MNEIKTSKGVLKYRNPTVFENMKILKMAKSFYDNNDPIGAKIAIMEKVSDFLDYSLMNEVKTFEDLCKDGDEMTAPLNELSDIILQKASNSILKKG